MTTEVLRNMMYAGSPTLRGLGFVVMDEVHYLADRFRGAGVGGGHHPPARGRQAGLAVGDGQQRRGVRRLAGRGARRRRGGRLRAPAGAAVAAHDGRASDLYDLFVDETSAPPRPAMPPASTPTCWRPCGVPSSERVPCTTTPTGAASGRARGRRSRGPGGGPAAAGRGRWPLRRRGDPRRGDRRAGRARRCCRRSRSSSAGSAATPRSRQLLPHGRPPGPPTRRASGSARIVEERVRPAPRRGPRRARLLGLRRRALPRLRGPPRRDAADLPGGRRGAVHRGPDPRGVRDRDPGARHQHAGAHRGARAAGQVQRRDPRRRHAGGVHPADRPGRPAGHRHRGARGRAVDTAAWTRWPSPGSRRRAPTRCGRASAPRTTWPSTSSAQVGRERAREVLETSFAQFQADRAVVGLARQRAPQRGGASAGYAEAMQLPPRRLRRVRRAARRDPPTVEKERAPSAAPPATRAEAAAEPGGAADRRRHPHPGRPPRRLRRRGRAQQGRAGASRRPRRCSPRTGRSAG